MQKFVEKLQSAQVIVVDELAFGKLCGKVDSQGEKLSEISKAVYGNGRSGLVETTGRIEERLGLMEERLDGLDGRMDGVNTKLDGLDEKLDEITSMFQKHIDDPNLHSLKGLIWHRKILVDIFVVFMFGFLLLHAVLPPEFTIWSLIKSWLGL